MAATVSCVMAMGRDARSRPGSEPVEVRRAKVRDRGEVGAEEKIRFTSSPATSDRAAGPAEWQADTQQLAAGHGCERHRSLLDAPADPAQATECGADR